MNGVKTYIAFGDVHYEDKFLDMLYPLISDMKPDNIVIAGDFADFQIISDFDKHERRFIGKSDTAKKIMKEIDWANAKFDYIDKISPKSRKAFIKGNHEVRFDKFCRYEEVQFNEGSRLIENQFRIRDRKWDFVDLGGRYKIGKCYFLHGERIGGENPAKIAALKFRKNVRLWHHHTNQSFMITSPLDSKDCFEAKSIGCLCEKDPIYLRGLTNRWANSFLVGYVYPNGNFQDFVVNIIDDKYVAPNGKIYA